jgi:PASTA domain
MLIAQTPTTTNTTTTHLSSNDWIIALALTVGLILAAGIVVAVSRFYLEGRPASADASAHGSPAGPADKTLIRSWLAISLAGGLLLFCAISFGLDDTTLRSTLIGGLVANAGAAVAFYFASRASDQARHDILAASFPSVVVPNLVGKTEQEVNSIMATTSLHLVAQPPDRDKATATVVSQNPAANQAVPQSSQITVDFASPEPEDAPAEPPP